MGRYANWADVTGRYKDAASIVGAEGIGSYYLGAAEDEVDGRCAALYTVPFTPTPGVVKDIVVDLTYYKMIVMRENAALLKDYINERMEAIIGGTLTLTTSGGVAPGIGSLPTVWGTHTDYHAPFNVADPITWNPDPDEVAVAEAQD